MSSHEYRNIRRKRDFVPHGPSSTTTDNGSPYPAAVDCPPPAQTEPLSSRGSYMPPVSALRGLTITLNTPYTPTRPLGYTIENQGDNLLMSKATATYLSVPAIPSIVYSQSQPKNGAGLAPLEQEYAPHLSYYDSYVPPPFDSGLYPAELVSNGHGQGAQSTVNNSHGYPHFSGHMDYGSLLQSYPNHDESAASRDGHQQAAPPPSLSCPEPGCKKKFTGKHAKRNLARHISDKHTIRDPYQCSVCGKVFQRSDALTKHKRGACSKSGCSTSEPGTSNESLTTNETGVTHITSVSTAEQQATHASSYSSVQGSGYIAHANPQETPEGFGAASRTPQRRSNNRYEYAACGRRDGTSSKGW